MEIIKINRYQWIVLSLGMFLLLVFQSALGGVANFLLLFGIVASLNRTLKHVLIIAVILGLLSDFASGLPDGVFLIAFPATLAGLYFVSNKLLPNQGSIYIQALMVAGAILGFYLMTMILMLIFGYNSFFVLKTLWLQMILNFLFFYPVYLYYRLVSRMSRYES